MFALLFVAWVGEWPLELDPIMFSGLWRSPFGLLGPMFAPLPGIKLFPWQVLLLVLAPVCLAARVAGQPRARDLEIAMIVSAACIAVTVAWGWLLGGSLYFAYYQVWRFLAALVVAYVLLAAIRGPQDLVALAKFVVVAALIRGTLVIYFYWVHIQGKVYPRPHYMSSHDDSLLFVMAILICGGWALLEGSRKSWIVAGLVGVLLFYAMILNDQRIAWVELIFAAGAIYVLIGSGPLRRTVNKILAALVPLMLIYVAVGWGREGAIFSPIQALSSVKSGADASSLTRQEELRNLLYTLVETGNPLFGTGWGRPYQIIERFWSNYDPHWIFVPFTPHNSLVGLAVFSGLVGVIGIWGVVPLAAYCAARAFRRSTDPVTRTAAMVATGTLVAYSVHCYGDIGLQSFACCMMFGAALATAGCVSAWSAAEPVSQPDAAVPESELEGRRLRRPSKAFPARSRGVAIETRRRSTRG
jgi:hypothetical protein